MVTSFFFFFTCLVQYDTMAESFRASAAEYRLLTTRITSLMRKERVYPPEWAKLW